MGLGAKAPPAALGGEQNPSHTFLPGGQMPKQEREPVHGNHQSAGDLSVCTAEQAEMDWPPAGSR